jgi:phage shock protein A
MPEAVTQLDAQLQALAEALAQTEASRESLQQQYNETTALLKQTLDAHDRGAGG